MIHVAVVDDHELFREGLVMVLNQMDDIEVIADFGSGQDFLKAIGDLNIDLVLMDINMDVMNGVETTQKLKALKPEVKVIAVTMYTEDSYYLQMINAGAHGFVLKKAGRNRSAEVDL